MMPRIKKTGQCPIARRDFSANLNSLAPGLEFLQATELVTAYGTRSAEDFADLAYGSILIREAHHVE